MIEVEIEEAAWTAAAPEAGRLAAAAAAAALDHEGARGGCDIAILLAGNARLQALNAAFRGHDAATNVLAFPAASGPAGGLGDVALAFGVCRREAAEQGKSLADHLQHLAVHGVLHLLGYDHLTDAEAERMEARERAILAGLGVADPYA
ncbi:MAG TPA: rRNA maturation RNase YbeY [Caulobacteraceae bacterium]|nr:rRNA maturation RNase YbeY [Caulobacteraceae bacterium]